MTEQPTTAAGRALLNRLGDLPKLMPYDDEARDGILAIEAEARQQDGSALLAAIDQLVAENYPSPVLNDPWVPVREIKRLLAALPPSAPPALADSWRDTGNRGAAEHRARQEQDR